MLGGMVNYVLQFMSEGFFFFFSSRNFKNKIRAYALFCGRISGFFILEQVATLTETHRKELTDIELALLEQRATLLARFSSVPSGRLLRNTHYVVFCLSLRTCIIGSCSKG